MTDENEVFSDIYENGLWNPQGNNPKSGSGSSPKNATTYLNVVRDFISEKNIKTVLDFGHGDWEMWEGYKFEDVNYFGVDVVPELTLKLQKRYGNSSRSFRFFDFRKEEFSEADLFISKDVMQHLSNRDLRKLLKKLYKFSYLIICNDVYTKLPMKFEVREFLQLRKRLENLKKLKSPFFIQLRRNNKNISTGNFRGIDLERKPLCSLLSFDNSSETNKFKLVKIIDYDGPRRFGLRKRIYVFERI
jgi:hypothetical protein